MAAEQVKVAEALADLRLLFLDTAPVIYHVEAAAAYTPITDVVFRAITEGKVQAVTSCITLAECLVHPYRHGDMELAGRFRDVITAGGHTSYVGVDASVERAAELRARYNLSLTDALQVAAAMSAGCDAFLTNDGGLKRVAEIRILVVGELLP